MIEDELRSVMSAHDEDAPSVDGFTPVVRRDRRLPSVAAAVVVIALVVGGVVWLRSGTAAPEVARRRSELASSPVTTGSPATCPDTPRDDGNWVPDSAHAPRNALVPRTPPESVIVCAYLGSPSSGASTGQTELHGDLRSIADTLHSVPRDLGRDYLCDLGAVRTDFDNYLIRLNYRGVVVWVAAPGSHCATSNNGQFVGATNLRAAAAQAYRHGVWDTDPSLQKLCEVAPNVHASRTLPLHPTGLTLCVIGNATTVYRFNRAQLDQVRLGIAGRYNGYLARAPRDAVCGTFDTARQRIVARLTYRDQREAVIVGTPSCIAADGGAAVTGKFAARVFSLLYFAPSYLP